MHTVKYLLKIDKDSTSSQCDFTEGRWQYFLQRHRCSSLTSISFLQFYSSHLDWSSCEVTTENLNPFVISDPRIKLSLAVRLWIWWWGILGEFLVDSLYLFWQHLSELRAFVLSHKQNLSSLTFLLNDSIDVTFHTCYSRMYRQLWSNSQMFCM